MECDDADCRLANTLTAAADCMLTLVLMLLLPRKLRRHVEAVSRRVDHARVTLADYSVELRGLPEDVTQHEVREIVSCTLQQHAEARLRRLQQKEASIISRCTERRHAFRPPSLQRVATRELKLEAELLGGAIERARRFLTEERWRVHEDGVTLCLRNGRLLSRARRKVPLLRRIEVLQKHDERLKALRRGPPSLLERLGDWRRARQLRREQDRLEATSAGLLHEVYNGTDAQRAVSAIVTFEEEEGKLEALHAFPPLGFGSCTTGAPVAREVPEPSDRFLHNLEYRGSWGNMARALFSYAALLVVVGASFSLLFASQNIDTLLTVNSTSFACDGLKQIVAAGQRGGGGGGDGGGGDGGYGGDAFPDALSGEEAGSGGATEDAGSGDEGGGAYFLCLDLSTQVHFACTTHITASCACIHLYADLSMTQALSFLPVFVGPAVNNLLYGVVDVLAKLQPYVSILEAAATLSVCIAGARQAAAARLFPSPHVHQGQQHLPLPACQHRPHPVARRTLLAPLTKAAGGERGRRRRWRRLGSAAVRLPARQGVV